jgi:antirestriction protein ArdC
MTRDEAQKAMEATLSSLTSDNRWEAYLSVMAKFHRYSVNNSLLIFCQRPDATLIKGYHGWRTLGRQVRRGERSITILAPLIKREIVDERADPEPHVVGFRAVSVFDVAQTDGDPLRGMPELLQTAEHGRLLEAIHQAIPFPVSLMQSLNGANGVFNTQARAIAVVESLAPDMRTKTLLHEWAHGLRDPADQRSRNEEEVIAEATAYVVASHYGLDTRRYSVGYVASWSEGDGKSVLNVTEEILRRSQAIVAPLDEYLQERQRAPEHAGPPRETGIALEL